MSVYLLPGLLGLMTGLLLHWTGFSRPSQLRLALGLYRSYALRSGLTALGWGVALTALLCWLAVIDVDGIRVLPLSLGAILGGLLLGVSAGLCGYTPTTAFAGLGTLENLPEALCVLAGCTGMTLLLPALFPLLAPLHTAAPYCHATLLQFTLDKPCLLGGFGQGFLIWGGTGLLLAFTGLCIPSPRPVIIEPAVLPLPPAADAAVPAPETAPEDTFVGALPGEEPLVVDTALDEQDPAPQEDGGDDDPPAADTAPDEQDPAPQNDGGDDDPPD